MPNPNKPKNKTGTGIFIQLAIVLLGLIGGYIYYSQIIKPGQILPSVMTVNRDDGLGKFKNLDSFDFKILNDPTFKSLKILGDIPVKPGTTGKTDLFAPF